MFRPVAPRTEEFVGTGQEQHPPATERPPSRRSVQPATSDPLASSTIMRPATERPTSRGSSVSEVDELVRRARYAKRELAAVMKELGDIVIDSASSIADELDDEYRAMDVECEDARARSAPGEHGGILEKVRHHEQIRHRGLSAAAAHSNVALEAEFKRIDEQCEQRMLEEKLRVIEECEKRRQEEKRRLLHASLRQPTRVTARQPEPAVNGSHSESFELLNQSQLSARKCTSRELPTFSGDPQEWSVFIANYKHSTAICGYTNEENLLRLQQCLKGKARDAVESCLYHPSSVPEAIDILTECYGRPELIVESLMTKIRRMPPPKDDRFDTLVDYGVAVRNLCAAMKSCGLQEYLSGGSLLNELVEKLPPTVRLNWFYQRNINGGATLLAFNDWMKELVSAACQGVKPISRDLQREGGGRSGHPRKYANVNVHVSGQSAEPVTVNHGEPCSACSGKCSSLAECGKFLGMDVNSRWRHIKTHAVCRTCLKKHPRYCRVDVLCGVNGCNRRHNKLLHDEDFVRERQSGRAAEKTMSCNLHVGPYDGVLLKYIPVTLHGKGRTINTLALLDDGSTATFMDHSLVEELGLVGQPRPLCISWTGNQGRREEQSVEVSLKISGVESSAIFDLHSVHTVASLSLRKQSVAPSVISEEYEYLKGLPLRGYTAKAPRILIGVDNIFVGQALRTVEREPNEPAASKTRLGWVLYGPYKQSGSKEVKMASVNAHICPCNKERDDRINMALKDYFTLESLGIYRPTTSLRSRDEERALMLLGTSVHLKDNRYEAGLLWKYEDVKLPDSRAMALKRHECLERKLRRDPDLAKAMHNKIVEYEQKGYVRKLTPEEQVTRTPNDWYLPIFPVTNPNKPGKIRVVFDAAAKANGVSLNSMLLTGPDQLVSLLMVLFKFREYKVAVTGDIREMFFQVDMNPRDQRSQMFLWNDGKLGSDPQHYVLQVMTFGAACSPSTAHYVKNVNAERFEATLPKAVECIKYEHYVDDMLASVETEQEAINLARDVQYIHSQGGFEIRNWLSNSTTVKILLNGNENNGVDIPVESEMTTEKVLGMWWNTATDVFTFKISPRYDPRVLLGERAPTKRIVLKTLMAIYDPLGLIGNFLMYLKILLQEFWRAKSPWDDEVIGHLAVKWQIWVTALPNVQRVSVPRCYRSKTTANAERVELHMFCDASENGASAVAYLRFEENGVIECALVGSKTKVAPITFVSIPRLELQAAVIGARLAETIQLSHRIAITHRFLWTDSRTVMSWLLSDHRRYSQFVAVRVSELLDTTNPEEWNWLSTRLNVADEGTKWQKPPDLSPSSRWFRGPDFLWEPKDQWPIVEQKPGETSEEIRHSLLHHTVTTPNIEFTRFSKWQRLLRAVAYVYRFLGNCRKGIAKEHKQLDSLTHEELERAENAIYRDVQRSEYADEIHVLSSKECVKHPWKRPLQKSSPLYKLSPMLDVNGVLRIKGRIEKCVWVGEDTKRPIILPRRHYVTELLIHSYHSKYKHANHQTVVNEVRLKYHIPQLKATYNQWCGYLYDLV
ncbi:uncharacterized protein LOC131293715 [Anopheles ziemanni]|uniref:uncharacterized protein LOC131264499 n=1 Tax=Anopheles coustani TaxID=139045 RepID=UPI00265A3987|nr:uncharacterized protein LOC131264499 [Anopheles coustani]XP_058177771.1 uncharacterized protein LOC131293715 [Anopheles ziemanni]